MLKPASKTEELVAFKGVGESDPTILKNHAKVGAGRADAPQEKDAESSSRTVRLRGGMVIVGPTGTGAERRHGH